MDIPQNQSRGRGIWGFQLTLVLVAFVTVLCLSNTLIYGFSEATTRTSIRWTARMSAIYFSLAFAASALHSVVQQSWSWWLFMNRKFIGISFAFTHLIHLGVLVILQYQFHPVFELAKVSSLIGGGIAYAFLILMLITSFKGPRSLISNKNWTLLHTVGGYWIWFIFIKSYWKRAGTEGEYIPLVLLLAVVLFLRVWKKLKT